MITLFKAGGVSMFFILGFGLVTLVVAFWSAIRPSEAHRAFVKHMARATLYAVLCGLCANFATVGYALYDMPVSEAERGRTFYEGMAESLAAGILGFAILSLVSLLTAVAERRLAARTS